ncbi:MAG: hypothetical protein M0P31_18560 [Solirubrobacteraceae bacterium]|nr:hypothetical protein [Solirubrobacteraceae bacterium]
MPSPTNAPVTTEASRVGVLVPDPELGSEVVDLVRDAGHEPILAGDLERLHDADRDAPLAAIVADLTTDGEDRARDLAAGRPPGVPVLACFAPPEPEVRAVAIEEGLELVVPRSRLMRETDVLLRELLALP